MSSRITQQWLTFSRMWYLVDAYKQPPGRLASLVTPFLTGKNKPIYHPLSDVGDHVVIINTKHVAFSKDKWKEKIYHHHTGYPGGFSSTPAFKVHEKDPKKIVYKSIYGMLPKDLRRRTMMCRLHLFEDDNIPEDIRENIVEHIKGPRDIPRTLREYTPEERAAFPTLWYPIDPLKKS
ncbi:39S ribosomal protein L13, mitochondrial-like [Anneissia japonica]|uniref:39S ribosomal protein L13, mitochondrial-like n=1 Tax=Anneissia japonica TaxID=1529436 RepID=UPI0014255EB3|nr:39S ribosomal protein L13, mitochondrial-like [Anneissia japonica]